MTKNLYRISQTVNNGYDTYDSAIVCASSWYDAKHMHPDGDYVWDGDNWTCPRLAYRTFINWHAWAMGTWCNPKDVKIEVIGSAASWVEPGVVLASFNAG